LSGSTNGGRLFGTDGVRGPAGEFLDAQLAVALGGAAVAVAGEPGAQVLVLRDTRESGEMLEAALAAGVAAAGGTALLAGVLPTAAAPLLLRSYGLQLAAVISASHNPYADNGIKFFGADGFKLDDDRERELEARLREGPVRGRPGRVRRLRGCLEDYLRLLAGRFGSLQLGGRRILLDCANGATYRAAPELFARLGARVEAINANPDGRNINAGCGSTEPEQLRQAVVAGSFDLGFAFDGDGDRVIAVDGEGTVADGDELIALIALSLRRRGALEGGVALTVMSNLGLVQALAAAGIETAQTPVGDRHVLAELRKRGWRLGGEQSGHIIDLRHNGCGDGIATALLALEALGDGKLKAGAAFRRMPQLLVNVAVGDREQALASEQLQQALAAEQRALAGRGRVLVRASGTEQLVRVMVEAEEEQVARETAERLVSALAGERRP